MPFLINGEHKPDAFKEIEIPKGTFAIFKRHNFNGFVMQSAKGPITKHTASCGVTVDFVTLESPLSPTNLNQVHVRYYTNKSTVMGAGNKLEERYTPDAIDFIGESLKVNLKSGEGQDLFRMLMINPMNIKIGSKVGKEMPISYELYEPQKQAQAANKATSERNKAIALVYDEEKVPNDLAANIHKHILQTSAQAFNVHTTELVETENFDQIRLDLSNWATKNHAQFEKFVANVNVGLRSKIKDAETAGIIIFKRIEMQWEWLNTKKDRRNKVIATVPPGEDEMTELISFLTSNSLGKRLTEEIEGELKAVAVTA